MGGLFSGRLEWTDVLAALGTVKAHEAVTVTAKVSETVERVHFDSGQEVARGAPLLTLSGQQQQALLASAQAQLADAQQQFQRMSQLAAQQLVARSALDSARASRDAASAQVAQISANLSDRVIRAPFAGVLGIRQVSPGALVTPGTVIATLDDISRVYVDFPVPETELADVAVGQTLDGRVDAWPGRSFTGTVETVSARLDSATRAAMVRGSFANPERLLKPGMYGSVEVSAGSSTERLSVPDSAVLDTGTRQLVLVDRGGGQFEPRTVELGMQGDGYVEILSGITQGEAIVVNGNFLIDAESNLRAAVGGSAHAHAGASKSVDSAPEAPVASPNDTHANHGVH